MSRFLILIITSIIIHNTYAAEEVTVSKTETEAVAKEIVNQLEEPLYNPFVERYVLDELKQLRIELASQKVEMIQQIVDREITAVDKAVRYSTDTVTYFFYLIAGVSSVLVLVGWTSIREIKDRVHKLADEEITNLITEYEQRLHAIEQQLNQKTQHIEENREEIELTQDVQSLWLRAGQDSNPSNKIAIYDQILELRKDDCEALTYKADAVLELNEPQWALNLCNQALEIDPGNSHAYYQLACANTAMNQFDEAVRCLSEVLQLTDSYREDIKNDLALNALHDYEPFKKLLEADK